MPSDADDDLASTRALADAIIRAAFRRDPDRVVAVVAEVIERLQAERLLFARVGRGGAGTP